MGVFPFDSGLFFFDPTFVIPKAFFRLIRQDVVCRWSVTVLLQKIPPDTLASNDFLAFLDRRWCEVALLHEYFMQILHRPI